MKHLLTLTAIFALLLITVPGCDVGGTRGPSSEQMAELQQLESDFAPIRSEAEQLVQELKGRGGAEAELYADLLEDELKRAADSLSRLRSAPRNQWNEYKDSAEAAISAVETQIAEAREQT